MSACACMGPQNGDPVCPCRMKSGFSQTYFGAEFLPLVNDAPAGYHARLVEILRKAPLLTEDANVPDPEQFF